MKITSKLFCLIVALSLISSCVYSASKELPKQSEGKTDEYDLGIEGVKTTLNPFKGAVFYDGRSQEAALEEIRTGQEPATDVQIKFPNFDVTIYNYGVEETAIDYRTNKTFVYSYMGMPAENISVQILGFNNCKLIPEGDTIRLNEWVFNDLSNKVLHISDSKYTTDVTYKLSAVLEEKIWQQPPATQPIDYEKWDSISDKWQGVTPTTHIKDSAQYFFKIPLIQTLSDFETLRTTLNLRDTLSVIHGEYDDVAEFVYKDHPVHFLIDAIVLRIDAYRHDSLIETKYIRIVFSYGC